MSLAQHRATVALIGMRCSGKSVTGRALAAKLGLPFLDLDEELLVDAGHAGVHAPSAGALLMDVGQLAFRGFESSALRRVLEPCQQVVLATGGGALESPANRGWLKRAARCVWLRADVDVLHRRMQADDSLRPALLGRDPLAEVGELLKRRSANYAALSELEVDTGNQEPELSASQITLRLGLAGES